MKHLFVWGITLCGWALPGCVAEISPERMQAIYDEIKTPYKIGVVIPKLDGRSIDCPNVFRYQDKWYMVFVRFEPDPQEGYTTQLAVSDDLLTWTPLGRILERGEEGTFDHANAGGGVALFTTEWGGDNELATYQGTLLDDLYRRQGLWL